MRPIPSNCHQNEQSTVDVFKNVIFEFKAHYFFHDNTFIKQHL